MSDGRMTNRRIVYVLYTNPAAYPPIEHSAWILAEAGWDVLLLGTSIAGMTLTLPHHPRIRVELMLPAEPGWRQKLHYLRFAGWALQKAWQHEATWAYASDLLTTPIAWLLSVMGLRIIYHEHDSPQPGAGDRSRFVRTLLRARRRVARIAELCVLPSRARTEMFQRAHPEARCLTVWNCPSTDEVRSIQRAVTGAPVRVLYHGTIVPARLPLAVIDALARVGPKVQLVVVGYETQGHRGYCETLRERAVACGVDQQLILLGPMSRGELMAHCATCDIGLAFMPLESTDVNERTMVGASNKPFDYLACGLPLLVSELPAWRETFVDPGYALACDPASPESIASALATLVTQHERRRAMGEQGRARILADWNYVHAFAPVLERLQSDVPASAAVHRGVVSPSSTL